ncbi:GPI-anchored CFEM domain protein A [Madurella mycetomatis]|uniref:GPI-anchored CFEM domain protein A n=1 Tax=Madurella mycetomatis TaxID=100816 RepID=A0A175WI45_9PEZI|nr:GPI-anchored CFEM domain protein A [Madurella mycetomatis]
MKTIATAILALIGAALVVATDFPSNMPDCGRICGSNMLAQAAELGCQASDLACLCRNVNFGYGIHDCSVEACGDTSHANIAIGWGNAICDSAGVPANIPTATAVSPVVTVSEVISTVTDDSSTSVMTSMATVSDGSMVTTSDVFTSGSFTTTITREATFVSSVTSPISPETTEPFTVSSSALGAQMTGGPALGAFAAVGIAAALL